jgi:hypothetical protein
VAREEYASKVPQEINVTHPKQDSSLELAMNSQISQKDKFDQLATVLLKTAALRDDEIESIVASDELFSSVRARLIADSVKYIEPTDTISFFQRTAILTAAAAIIVVAVFGTMMVAKRPNVRTVVDSTPASNADKNLPEKKTGFDAITSRPSIEEPEIRVTTPRVVKAIEYRPIVNERRASVQREPQIEEQPPQFFALAGLRPSEVAVDGSRIIRVELPRASLVTLGVNVPLDSDKQLIKTDLLVGPDGVPRAIRLVE